MKLDACCFLCRGAHGICLTRRTCDHHVQARAQDEADDRARRTIRRPTEDKALNNVMREQKRKGRPR